MPPKDTSSTTQPEGLRARNKREKLARIKRAARQLFEKKGYEATTAREICQRARIGTGTLFLYVHDKRELLFLVFQEEALRIFEKGIERIEPDMPLVDALMCHFDGFIEFYAGIPEFARELFQELLVQRHDEGGMGELTNEFIEHLAVVIAQAQKQGGVRHELHPMIAAYACFAHYSFWVQAWLGVRMIPQEEVQGGLRNALELQLEGFRPRRSRRTTPGEAGKSRGSSSSGKAQKKKPKKE